MTNPPRPVDLMAALERSIAEAKAWRAAQRVRPEKGTPPSYTGEIVPAEPETATRSVAARPGDAADQHELDKATELLTRLDIGHATTLERMRSAMAGQPGAANLDSGGSSGMTTRRWCFAHATEKDHDCADGLPCYRWSSIPKTTDGTGEAASSSDPAASDLKGYLKALKEAEKWIRHAAVYAERYNSHAANSIDQREVAALNVEPGCQNCAKVDDSHGQPVWSEVYRTSDVKGNLQVPMRLCHWDYRWVLDTGRLAHVGEVQAHLRGQKVMRPAEAVLRSKNKDAAA